MTREPTAQQRRNREISNGNLRPWKKGQSGNPRGSPKKEASITMYLRDELAKVENGKTKAQAIAEGMVKAAMSPVAEHGAPRVLSEVLDRTEGKVPAEVKIGGIEGGEPIQITGFKIKRVDGSTVQGT